MKRIRSSAFAAAQKSYQLTLVGAPLVEAFSPERVVPSKPLPSGTRYQKGIRIGRREERAHRPSYAQRM